MSETVRRFLLSEFKAGVSGRKEQTFHAHTEGQYVLYSDYQTLELALATATALLDKRAGELASKDTEIKLLEIDFMQLELYMEKNRHLEKELAEANRKIANCKQAVIDHSRGHTTWT